MKKLVLLILLLWSTLSFGGGLAYDKQEHLVAGVATYMGSRIIGLTPNQSLAMGISVGIAKELWDRKHPPHQCQFGDALATAVGASIMFTFEKKF